MSFADAMVRVAEAYNGSNGDVTLALFADLQALPRPGGAIAVNLFRAHKGSARAKKYRGGVRGRGSYKKMAYGKKGWAMDNLCKILATDAESCGIARWGWARDEKREYHADVLYIDLPTGQVSFHTEGRGEGPNYPGQWDGVKNAGAGRIIRWIAMLLAPPTPAEAAEDARMAGLDDALARDRREITERTGLPDAPMPTVQKDLFA